MPTADDIASPARPIEVFCSYSHKDESLRDELETHLSILKRRGAISVWHDRRISPGTEWNGQISQHLNTADLILLLVSANFIDSKYCFDEEMTRAMQRHQLREARVVPVILRDCIWDLAPFSKLQALPKDGKPVLAWSNRDEAFKNVALGIRRVAEELGRAPARPWRESQLVTPSLSAESGHRPQYTAPVRSPRDVRLYGPRIKVTVGPPILRALAKPSSWSAEPPAPRFTETDALIDTGAQRTVLSPEAARRVGLPKIGEVDLQVIGAIIKADVYAASLHFPRSGLRTIEVIEVSCCALPHALYHCLLGRDVLSRWVLNYDGATGTWQITENGTSSWVEPAEGFDPNFWGA